MSRDPQIANFHPSTAVDLTSNQVLQNKVITGPATFSDLKRIGYMDGNYNLNVPTEGQVFYCENGLTYNSILNFNFNDYNRGLYGLANYLGPQGGHVQVKVFINNISQGNSRPITFRLDDAALTVRWLNNTTTMNNSVTWSYNLWTFDMFVYEGTKTVFGKRETYGG